MAYCPWRVAVDTIAVLQGAEGAMSATSALKNVHRSLWGEAMYRLNWLMFGGIAAVCLAFVPIIGWAMAVGVLGALLWKVLGFREVLTVGACPACTKELHVNPKKPDVISCPACASVIQVQATRLVRIDVSR